MPVLIEYPKFYCFVFVFDSVKIQVSAILIVFLTFGIYNIYISTCILRTPENLTTYSTFALSADNFYLKVHNNQFLDKSKIHIIIVT